MFNLVSALIVVEQAASIALATYFSPEHAVIINSSIVIVSTTAIEVCNQFVKD